MPRSEKVPLASGRYVIRERMAEGGMGEVFLAVAVGADGFEKPVVIKRLLPQFASQPDVVRLLASEAKLMTRLIHPNIVQVIDFGRGDSEDYFLVMELVSGTDLGRFCQAKMGDEGVLGAALAIFIAAQILRGLAYAHGTASADGKRLVHRDISPGNVLLSTFGEVKVTDFGVALVASSAEGAGHDGWIVGKPAYMAPEQLARGSVDERADIYSVGVVLFQMLTGQLPLREGTQEGGLTPESRARLEAAAPPDLATIVEGALSLDPDKRYSSAREMARAIEQFAENGHRMATADELADEVAAVVARDPKSGSKAVLVLSGPSGLRAGTELRHTGAARAGEGFTVKIRDSGPDPGLASNQAPTDRSTRRGRRLWAVAIPALLLGLVMGTLFAIGGRWTVRTPAGAPPPLGTAPVVVQAPLPSQQLSAMPASEVTSATAQTVHSAAPAPRLAPHGRDTFKEVGTTSTEPSSCRGQVHIYADHSWVITGGPKTVEAPGRYDWPCGVYSLRASSRAADRQVRTTQVTVRESTAGIVDLR